MQYILNAGEMNIVSGGGGCTCKCYAESGRLLMRTNNVVKNEVNKFIVECCKENGGKEFQIGYGRREKCEDTILGYSYVKNGIATICFATPEDAYNDYEQC